MFNTQSCKDHLNRSQSKHHTSRSNKFQKQHWIVSPNSLSKLNQASSTHRWMIYQFLSNYNRGLEKGALVVLHWSLSMERKQEVDRDRCRSRGSREVDRGRCGSCALVHHGLGPLLLISMIFFFLPFLLFLVFFLGWLVESVMVAEEKGGESCGVDECVQEVSWWLYTLFAFCGGVVMRGGWEGSFPLQPTTHKAHDIFPPFSLFAFLSLCFFPKLISSTFACSNFFLSSVISYFLLVLEKNVPWRTDLQNEHKCCKVWIKPFLTYWIWTRFMVLGIKSVSINWSDQMACNINRNWSSHTCCQMGKVSGWV